MIAETLTRVQRRTGRDRTVGRVTRVVDDAHLEVAWGSEAKSEQPAVMIEFRSDLRAVA